MTQQINYYFAITTEAQPAEDCNIEAVVACKQHYSVEGLGMVAAVVEQVASNKMVFIAVVVSTVDCSQLAIIAVGSKADC